MSTAGCEQPQQQAQQQQQQQSQSQQSPFASASRRHTPHTPHTAPHTAPHTPHSAATIYSRRSLASTTGPLTPAHGLAPSYSQATEV
ncbi:hypothetical protein M0802_005058 [Mischocyttarus mexicanus]|nr:hypothetical protein M0802_005058 [Mischocyttarus mexicanus]